MYVKNFFINYNSKIEVSVEVTCILNTWNKVVSQEQTTISRNMSSHQITDTDQRALYALIQQMHNAENKYIYQPHFKLRPKCAESPCSPS